MKSKLFASLVIATALAGNAFAQEMPRGRWWQRPEIAKRLELSVDQQQRLDSIYGTAANELIDARAEVEKLQVQLRGALDQSTLDRANIQRIASRLNASRGKLFEREIMMFVDMRSVLSEQQWRQVRQAIAGVGMEPRPRGDRRGGMNAPNQPRQRPN